MILMNNYFEYKVERVKPDYMSVRCTYKCTTRTFKNILKGIRSIFSSTANSSRGVMILMNNNFEYKVERVKTD